MMGRLRQLSEPRLKYQTEIEKSQTSVERDILVQWVRKKKFEMNFNFEILRATEYKTDVCLSV